MQFLQCVFYSLLSLQKHGMSVKGHQNNPKKREFYRIRTAPPVSKILGSATEIHVYMMQEICKIRQSIGNKYIIISCIFVPANNCYR